MFWGECALAAIHIINRIPSTVLLNKSPFEMMFGKAPDLSYMKIIGCLCYATTLLRSDKFGPRAIKSVLMGYGTRQKGYKLYDLQNRVFFVSRDVVFNESIFPFQTQCFDDIQDSVSSIESSDLPVRFDDLEDHLQQDQPTIDDPIDNVDNGFANDLEDHHQQDQPTTDDSLLSSNRQQSTRTSRPPL